MPNPFDMLLESPEPRDESTWRWATVTSVSPLRIRLDQDDAPLDGDPIDLVGNLVVGDRVWVQLHRSRGRRGAQPLIMAAKPKPPDQDLWTSGIVPASGVDELNNIRIVREGRVVVVQARFAGVSLGSAGSHNKEIATITRSEILPAVPWTPWTSMYQISVGGLISRGGVITVRWSSASASNQIIYFTATWTL